MLIGPIYGLTVTSFSAALVLVGAFFAFAFASSACYVVNDIADREADKLHPRKKRRPIASGAISVPAARIYAVALLILSALALLLVPNTPAPGGAGLGTLLASADAWWRSPRVLLALIVGLYVANVFLYTAIFKRRVVLDVISLSGGFLLRVFGGCAAAGVEPSSWLLNVTFFVSMFLALGKRLGERRTLGDDAAKSRGVQGKYTDDLLRMAVVVTGVATLLSYGDYVSAAKQVEKFTIGFNLLWLTMLPATYALLRAMVLLERGVYDDPTEMAVKDRPFQVAVAIFGGFTLLLLVTVRGLPTPPAGATQPAPRQTAPRQVSLVSPAMSRALPAC